MMRTFTLTLFRFDARTDYLPYTTKYTLDFDYGASLKDLLANIKSKDVLVGLSEDGVRVNGVLCSLELSLVDIVSRFGQELYVEPLSTKRAVKDLHIDKDDFLERFDLLAPYVEKVDREFFQTLILLHYASPALRYNPSILGSAFYYFSAKMIEKYPKFEVQIADIASEPSSGVQYHLPLDYELFNVPEDLESQIISLIQIINKHFPDRLKEPMDLAQNPVSSPIDTMLGATAESLKNSLQTKELKHSFEGFKAGVYLGSFDSISTTMDVAIEFSKVRAITLANTHKPDGAALFNHDSNMACLMAGEILLEAFDNGCDFLLVDNPEYLSMFDHQQKACSKAVGRAINLPILTSEQLILIALGEIEGSGVSSHTCKVKFLPA